MLIAKQKLFIYSQFEQFHIQMILLICLTLFTLRNIFRQFIEVKDVCAYRPSLNINGCEAIVDRQ